MKTQDIIKALKANKNVSDYEIVISNKESRELFYVLKNLEINRATKIETTKINVYVDSKDLRGTSTIALNANDNLASLKKKINSAVIKAKQGLIPYYPLADKTKNTVTKCSVKENLNTIALKVGKAIFEADIYEQGWINSTEVFVSKVKRTFINSKGVKHVADGLHVEVEVIPTWSNSKEEFELYKWFEQSTPDYNKVTQEVDEILTLAQARSCAKKLKDVKIPKNIKVLVSNDMLETLVWSLVTNTSYSYQYYKMNHYKKNDIVSNNNLELILKGVDKNCSNSCPFDDHGVVLKNKTIIKNGKVIDCWGDIKHAYYFKKKASGSYPVIELKGKQYNYKKEKHIIVCNFSSPQLDEDTGYWGGEIRLAMYFDGKKYIPITNFSIAGNIYRDIKKVLVSKEEFALPDYTGPKYLIFEGLNIF